MKYLDMDKISDPFILELIEQFGVTGFRITTANQRYIVGHPTEKRFETKKQMRERWKRWKYLEKQKKTKRSRNGRNL